MNRVDGKVAIVTGGGSGIGEASSELLAEGGASVVVTDINEEAAQHTADIIKQRVEHLATSDRGIAMFRRLLRDAAEAVARGEDPPGTLRDANHAIVPVGARNEVRVPGG